MKTEQHSVEIKEAPSNRSWFVFQLAFWLVVCFLVAGLGSWATADGVKTWYQDLNRPSWNPPDWVFPWVWTTLFAMMAISAARITARRGWDRSVYVFLIQLGLNLLWSFLFFYFRQMFLAGVEIVLLVLAIGVTTYLFYLRDRLAGLLMLPYLVWVSFASFLNWTIVLLNGTETTL